MIKLCQSNQNQIYIKQTHKGLLFICQLNNIYVETQILSIELIRQTRMDDQNHVFLSDMRNRLSEMGVLYHCDIVYFVFEG